MKHTVRSIGLLLLLSVFVLAACNNDSAAQGTDAGDTSTEDTANGERVTLQFWTFWGSETRRPIIDKIIEDYNNSQDQVTVQHTFLPWGDIWTKNLASIAAGNAPDVIVNDINTVANRAEQGQVEDITEWAERDNLEDTIFPELWNTVNYDDKIYGLPFVTDTRLLFYNKDLFLEAGLDPERPPQTWAELEEYAEKLNVKEGDMYTRMGFYPLWDSFGADSWMLNADDGVGYYDKNQIPVVNTPAKAEELQWVRNWRERLGENAVNTFESEFGSQQANPFVSGKVAMFVDVATFYTQLRDYGQDVDFGVAPVPEREEGSGHYSVGGGFVVEIPRGTQHKEEAYDFLKYLAGKDAQTYWGAMNFDNVANIEASQAAAESEELNEKGREVYQMAIENMENTKMTPLPVWGTDTNNLVSPHIDNVLLNGADPVEELNQAQEALENLAP